MTFQISGLAMFLRALVRWFFCCLGFFLPTPPALLAAKKRISQSRKEGKRSEHLKAIPGRPWPQISFMRGRKMLLCKGCGCTRHWVCSVQLQWSHPFSLQLVSAALNFHSSSLLSLFTPVTRLSGPEELKFCHFSSWWLLNSLSAPLWADLPWAPDPRPPGDGHLSQLGWAGSFPQGSW